MPTTHPRHAITETDDISNALEIARRTWPDLADKPGALLRQLIIVGRNTLRTITPPPIRPDDKPLKRPPVHWLASSDLIT